MKTLKEAGVVTLYSVEYPPAGGRDVRYHEKICASRHYYHSHHCENKTLVQHFFGAVCKGLLASMVLLVFLLAIGTDWRYCLGIAYIVWMIAAIAFTRISRQATKRKMRSLNADIFYQRAKLIGIADRAYLQHFWYYIALHESYCHGALIDEVQAERHLTFLCKAERAILLAESNFILAQQRLNLDRSAWDREKLVELMAVLNQPAKDPVTELVDDRAGRVLDREEAFVEVIHELQQTSSG